MDWKCLKINGNWLKMLKNQGKSKKTSNDAQNQRKELELELE